MARSHSYNQLNITRPFPVMVRIAVGAVRHAGRASARLSHFEGLLQFHERGGDRPIAWRAGYTLTLNRARLSAIRTEGVTVGVVGRSATFLQRQMCEAPHLPPMQMTLRYSLAQTSIAALLIAVGPAGLVAVIIREHLQPSAMVGEALSAAEGWRMHCGSLCRERTGDTRLWVDLGNSSRLQPTTRRATCSGGRLLCVRFTQVTARRIGRPPARTDAQEAPLASPGSDN
jgi:hypothetical protein